LEGIGPADEPAAAGSLQAGADVVILAGNALLGGPACGIVLGSRPLVQSMTRCPIAGALAVDKLTLAALAATLRLWRDPDKARRAVPLVGLLGTSIENLQNRAERLAPQLAATAAVAEAEVIQATTYLAGPAVPSHALPTRRIAIKPAGMSVERLAAGLQLGTPPVMGIVEEGRLLLDLRSVIPRQDQELVEAFGVLAEGKG
jgi:L-seryl-tRNA(Ser) seleniumtransferase